MTKKDLTPEQIANRQKVADWLRANADRQQTGLYFDRDAKVGDLDKCNVCAVGGAAIALDKVYRGEWLSTIPYIDDVLEEVGEALGLLVWNLVELNEITTEVDEPLERPVRYTFPQIADLLVEAEVI